MIKWIIISLVIVGLFFHSFSYFITVYAFPQRNGKVLTNNIFRFNNTQAYNMIQAQIDLGPRYPGSKGIEESRHLIASELLPKEDWIITYQNFSKKWNDQNTTLVNVICKPKNQELTEPLFLLLAHYDTRLFADMDPDPTKRREPVLGANDGASGVAVAIELGRVLLKDYNLTSFNLVFFDGEDQGNVYGWDWLVGSRYYTQSQEFLNQNISFVILLDMVAGMNATFKREKQSDKYAAELVNLIWNEADKLGFANYFVNESGRTIIDDHVPFLEKGIPAIDIIDEFGVRYKPWHTTFDNMTYISKNTLKAIGQTLESVLTRTVLTSSEWLSTLSTFKFKSSVIIFDLMTGCFLLAMQIIYRKRKKGKN